MQKGLYLTDKVKYTNSFIFGLCIFLWFRTTWWLEEILMESFEQGTLMWRLSFLLAMLPIPLLLVLINVILKAFKLPTINLFFKDGSLEKPSRNGCVSGYFIGGITLGLLFRYLGELFG